MKKRILAMLLVVLMLLPMGTMAYAENTSGEVKSSTFGSGLTWTLYNDGELVISGTGEMNDYFSYSYSVPWYSQKSSITRVTIESGVTSIGNYAFYSCSYLTSVTIGESVTSIGNYAFSSCGRLTSVTMEKGVTSIGDYAFQNCSSLESVTMAGVTSIGDYAFSSCSSLTSITIPKSVNNISGNAFNSCSRLSSFKVAEENENYSNDEYGVLFNKDKTELIRYPLGINSATYTIPDNEAFK